MYLLFRLSKEVLMDNKTILHPEIISPARLITFILLLIVEIPALICTLIILVFFVSHWHSMMTKALHNHAVFLLIIISFFYITLDLPFTINSYRLGYNNIRTLSFCLWWYWIDYTLLATGLFLTATASIQRHILIFHSHWLRIKRTRWLIHFIPLIFCILYPAIFYLCLIYLYSCPNLSDEDSLTCPVSCYSDHIVIYNIDWIVNYISPVLIIVLANGLLIGRVIYLMQKIRHPQSNTWKRQRKLTFQLLSLSLLYICGWGPTIIISIIQRFLLPDLFDKKPVLYYINNSSYFVCPLQSFICIFALPELINFLKNRLRQRRIIPTIIASVVHDTHV